MPQAGFLLSVLSDEETEAIKDFVELHKSEEKELFKISEGKRLTDEQIKRKIIKILNGEDIGSLALKPKEERNKILNNLREKEGFSITQIERVTGISRGIVARCFDVTKKARPH